MRREGPTRRTLLAAGLAGVTSLSGCLDDVVGGDGGPSERSFEFTVTRSDGALSATVTPAGDVADVVQVDVGDDVTFTYHNETSVPVGVHNHVTDAEAVVGAGESHTASFSPAEGMVGRHEVEGFVAGDGHGEGSTEHDHGDGETTEHDHDETPTEHHDGETTEHGHEGTSDGHHDGETAVVLAVVEVRP